MMKKNLIKISVFLIALTMLVAPYFLMAATTNTGLVICGTVDPVTGRIPDDQRCNFSKLFQMLDKMMKFMLWLSGLVVIFVTIWTGFSYIRSFGDPGKTKEVSKKFKAVAIGIAIMLLAWVFVYTLEHWFLSSEFISPYLINN